MHSTDKWKSALCTSISLIVEECSRTAPVLLALVKFPFSIGNHFLMFCCSIFSIFSLVLYNLLQPSSTVLFLVFAAYCNWKEDHISCSYPAANHRPKQKTAYTKQYTGKREHNRIKESKTINNWRVTTAVNSVSFQFIARFTAAEKRAIGIDTSLRARVFSCAFIHI